jgi:hypothetical protein
VQRVHAERFGSGRYNEDDSSGCAGVRWRTTFFFIRRTYCRSSARATSQPPSSWSAGRRAQDAGVRTAHVVLCLDRVLLEFALPEHVLAPCDYVRIPRECGPQPSDRQCRHCGHVDVNIEVGHETELDPALGEATDEVVRVALTLPPASEPGHSGCLQSPRRPALSRRFSDTHVVWPYPVLRVYRVPSK